jgi:hypothetical protein
MVVVFREGDDQEARDISDGLRAILSEWLTVPIRFDSSMLSALVNMGDGARIEQRWGRDIRAAYDDAYRCAQRIQKMDNPIRTKLADVLRELENNAREFKIYCHSQARQHFETLSVQAGVTLRDNAFLHSVTQYRNAEPFDVLIKVGPLRARGWGSAPDALLTAPRFDTLIQVVWSGCVDEAGFGYDPVSAPLPGPESEPRPAGANASAPALRIGWETTEVRPPTESDDGPGDIQDLDDFEIFTRLGHTADMRRASLIQIDDDRGILYPPHSRLLSFDPAAIAAKSIDYRIPGETLFEGMFLIIPILDDELLNGLQAEEGYYSRIWKERLGAEFSRDSDGLINQLRSNGLDLRVLRSRVEHWCKPATTVIHAPQQMRHFEILISVLKTDFEAAPTTGKHRAPWWKYAWDEVRRARGEAIHTGFHEQQLEDEQLTVVLGKLETELRSSAAARDTFEIAIPEGLSLQGKIRFLKIAVLEEGFLAPSSDLKIVCELSTINQWRI